MLPIWLTTFDATKLTSRKKKKLKRPPLAGHFHGIVNTFTNQNLNERAAYGSA